MKNINFDLPIPMSECIQLLKLCANKFLCVYIHLNLLHFSVMWENYQKSIRKARISMFPFFLFFFPFTERVWLKFHAVWPLTQIISINHPWLFSFSEEMPNYMQNTLKLQQVFEFQIQKTPNHQWLKKKFKL